MSYPNWGNLKMRGKREKHLRCGCCVAWNKKRFPSSEDLKKILVAIEVGEENPSRK